MSGKASLTADRRGVTRKPGREITRGMVAALQLPECKEDEQTRREAFQLALANLHKPWARRYIRNFRFKI